MLNKTNKKILPTIIICSILFSIAVNCFYQFKPYTQLAKLNNIILKKDKQHFSLNMDTFMNTLKPHGNILVRFENFQPPDDTTKFDLPLYMYIKMCYNAYPYKVFAATKDIIINTSEPIVNHPFYPSKEWTEEHDITHIVTFFRDKKGNIHQKIIRTPYSCKRRK